MSSAVARDEAFFLRSLAERPGDQDTLAVYGDWLEERNEAQRAGVVRLHRDLLAAIAASTLTEPTTAASKASPRPPQGELTANEHVLVELATRLLDLAAKVVSSNPNDWLARLGRATLAGTRWEGVESIGTRTMGLTWSFPGDRDRLVMSGVFEYETPVGTNRNAHWLQVGRAVRTRLHSPAIVRNGVIGGASADRMFGTAVNDAHAARSAAKSGWSWTAERKAAV